MEDECNYTHLMCGEVVAMDVKGWICWQRRWAKVGRSGFESVEGSDGRAATGVRSGDGLVKTGGRLLKGG
jgi:hypothetical protein